MSQKTFTNYKQTVCDNAILSRTDDTRGYNKNIYLTARHKLESIPNS